MKLGHTYMVSLYLICIMQNIKNIENNKLNKYREK